MWTTSIITAPGAEPLDLDAEVAPFLRISSDEKAAQATLLAGAISGARAACESFTGRKLITQTVELWGSGWYEEGVSRCGRLRLPWAPVSAVSSVKYLDTAGVEQTWSGLTGYESLLPAGDMAQRAEVYPRYSVPFPSTRSRPDSIKVRYVVGYGAAYTNVPARLRQGMLLYVGEAYARRELATAGTILPDNPVGAERCWWPFRVF